MAKNDVTFTLSSYEAHQLLNELERSMSIVNRDTTNASYLWYHIAGQLNGLPPSEAAKHAHAKGAKK